MLGFTSDAAKFFIRGVSTPAVSFHPLGDDFDNDGIPTWLELFELGSDPLSSDTDSDGVLDGLSDSDGDGISDLSEILYGSGDFRLADTDGDGLSDFEERQLGTHPGLADSDGDGAPDSADAAPLDPTIQSFATDPADHTPPVITIISPQHLVL